MTYVSVSGFAAFVWALATGMPFLSAMLAGVIVAIVVSAMLLILAWLWVGIVSTYTDLMWPGSTAALRRARKAGR